MRGDSLFLSVLKLDVYFVDQILLQDDSLFLHQKELQL